MKRIALLAAVLAIGTPLASTEAQARHHHYRHHHYARHHYAHHWRHVGLSAACRRAAAMGGPCGCVAEELIFGRNDHVWRGRNLWLAQEWMRFPRSAPGPGKAAVWPHRHVEAIVRANGDGTITTNGPYGVRRVRLASVVVVDPQAGRGVRVDTRPVRRVTSID